MYVMMKIDTTNVNGLKYAAAESNQSFTITFNLCMYRQTHPV